MRLVEIVGVTGKVLQKKWFAKDQLVALVILIEVLSQWPIKVSGVAQRRLTWCKR